MLADLAFVLVSAGGGALMLLVVPGVDADRRPLAPGAGFTLDVALGLAVCLAMFARRRWPVALGLVTLIPEVFSLSAGTAALLSVLIVAMYRPVKVALAVAALHQLVIFGYYPLWATQYPFWIVWLWSLTELTGLVAWGMWVRTRRQLIVSLHEQVARARAEQHLLAEQARLAERARIAREMHDVVAHRVSLMALHAGALEVRPDLPADAISETAGLIRSTARQALEELRDAIGVLRDGTGDGDGDRGPASGAERAPQPTLRDLPRLVEDSRRAGMKIELAMSVEETDRAPGALGRDTYRIVREALTNVGKHARGAATTVTVAGRPGDGLRVTVRNRLPLQRSGEGEEGRTALPGAGVGLVGLTERVALAGGTLRHGPSPDGDFVVDATLRWAR
jgi:signal transduction histidine kinase